MGMAMSRAMSVPRQSANTPSRRMILRRPSAVDPYAEHSGPLHNCAAMACSVFAQVVAQPSRASFLRRHSQGLERPQQAI